MISEVGTEVAAEEDVLTSFEADFRAASARMRASVGIEAKATSERVGPQCRVNVKADSEQLEYRRIAKHTCEEWFFECILKLRSQNQSSSKTLAQAVAGVEGTNRLAVCFAHSGAPGRQKKVANSCSH